MVLVQKEIKRVTIRPNGTEKQIRLDTGWQPGPNTVAYYPLSSDLTDTVHSQTLTPEGRYTFETVGGASVNSITISQALLGTNSYLPTGSSNRTISLWCRITARGQNDAAYFAYGNTSNNALCCTYGNASQTQISQYGKASSNFTAVSLNTWTHICTIYNGSQFIIYKDGTQIGTWNYGISTSGSNVYVNQIPWAPTYGNKTGNWSNIIIENKARTATEVQNYYNQTKGNYGL